MPHKEDDISYLLSQISEGNSSCFEKNVQAVLQKNAILLHYISFSPLLRPKMCCPTSFSTLWHKRENFEGCERLGFLLIYNNQESCYHIFGEKPIRIT